MAVIYPKYSQVQAASGPAGLPRPPRGGHAGAMRFRTPGTAFMLVLLVVLGWGMYQAMQHREGAQAWHAAGMAEQALSGGAAGGALADAMLHMSETDAALLRSLPGRLEGACERNGYALGQQACRARMSERGVACLAPVARRFPEQARETDHMAAIIGAYQHCVFGEPA